MTIRPVRNTDAGALVGLTEELGYPATLDAMLQRIAYVLSDERHAVFVAERGAVLGWVHVTRDLTLESGGFAEVRGLVVASAERRNGIGRLLMARAEDWAASQGCERIRVRTNVTRTGARDFYAGLGFEPVKMQQVADKLLVQPAGARWPGNPAT